MKRPCFDAFEPSFLQNALKMAPEMGELVFGCDTWLRLRAEEGITDEHGWSANPLLKFERRRINGKCGLSVNCHDLPEITYILVQ